MGDPSETHVQFFLAPEEEPLFGGLSSPEASVQELELQLRMRREGALIELEELRDKRQKRTANVAGEIVRLNVGGRVFTTQLDVGVDFLWRLLPWSSRCGRLLLRQQESISVGAYPGVLADANYTTCFQCFSH